MIKNLYEDDLGYMVGTFYSDVLGYDIEVRYDKELSQKYVEKNIYYFNNLEQEFLVSICDALRRYYENYEKLYPDLCEDLPTDILNDFINFQSGVIILRKTKNRKQQIIPLSATLAEILQGYLQIRGGES